MTVKTRSVFTPQEYLAMERQAEQKSEYLNGEIFAMGGASPVHNLIVTNTIRELSAQLKKRPCKVYANDMRVKVSLTGLYTYPDVVVVCGEERFDDAQKDTLLNPTVIVEVLSDSTEGYDRGKKFEHYRKLESLQQYVLIAQKNPHVECYQRQQNNRWLLAETNDLQDTLQLTTIEATLILAEIYDKVLASQ
jgi:Uma2 family endonuclease